MSKIKKIGKFKLALLIVMLIGLGTVIVYATGILANPTTHKVFINGNQVDVEGYMIDGSNYFKLRDIVGNGLNNSVVFDGATDSVHIDTTKEYDPNEQYITKATPKPEQKQEATEIPKIKITVGGKEFSAVMYNSEAAHTFISKLPIIIDMSDVNNNEKFYQFTERLTTETSSCPGTINAGDIMCYSSNGLVLFYKTFSTSYSYVKLGHIEDVSGLTEALGTGNTQVTFSVK